MDETTAEEYLFGREHVEGVIKKARFGTLFLHEVSALPDLTQAKLLHFIETGEVVRHDNSVKKYDVRLVVSTQYNLLRHVEKGSFRADLYYHLNVIPIELPTLNARQNDVIILLDYFFRQLVHEQRQRAPELTAAALKQLTRYDWPGNVLELKNLCERLFMLFSGKTVELTNLPQALRQVSSQSLNPFLLPETGIDLEQVEMDLIHQALQTTSGNKSRAARLLGLTRDTFLYRLKKYAIDA